MKTDNLFINFELLLMWEKLMSCTGKSKNGENKKMVICNSEIEGDCLWWSGMKLCRKRSEVIIKDMDYAFMSDARQVTNERYIKRMVDFVMATDKTTLYNNRANPDFVKQGVRGICRFGDHLTENVTDKLKKKIKQELLTLPVLEVAAKYNLTEHYVKKLKYEKSRTV